MIAGAISALSQRPPDSALLLTVAGGEISLTIAGFPQ
jgi:hypothetical protein